jgi:hypothetical protein
MVVCTFLSVDEALICLGKLVGGETSKESFVHWAKNILLKRDNFANERFAF